MNVSDRIDFSQINFPENLIWNRRPGWEVAVKVTCFIPVILIGSFGNGFVIYLMATTRFLRTSMNLFILNMACSDFISIVLLPWIVLYMDLYQNFVLGQFICLTEGFFRVTLMLVSVLSLMAVSYDRFVTISFPFRPRMTIKTATIIIVAIWVLSLSIAAPIITSRSYNERQWANFLEQWCTEDKYFSFYYYYVLNAILVWLPVLLMCTTYIWIFIKLRVPKTDNTNAIQFRRLAHRRRAARMLSLILLSFIVCWIPFTVTISIRNSVIFLNLMNSIPSWLPALLYASRYFISVNTAVNPIIYGLWNDNFKRAVYQQFPKLKSIKFLPAPLSTLKHSDTNFNTSPNVSLVKF